MVWWWTINWRENEEAAHVKLHHPLPLLRQHCIISAGGKKSAKLSHCWHHSMTWKQTYLLSPHSAVLGTTGSGHRAGEQCCCQHHWTLANGENWSTLLCLFCLCGFSSLLLVFSSNNSYLWILFFKILLAKVWLQLNCSIMLIVCAVVQSLLSHIMLEWATGHNH